MESGVTVMWFLHILLGEPIQPLPVNLECIAVEPASGRFLSPEGPTGLYTCKTAVL